MWLRENGANCKSNYKKEFSSLDVILMIDKISTQEIKNSAESGAKLGSSPFYPEFTYGDTHSKRTF